MFADGFADLRTVLDRLPDSRDPIDAVVAVAEAVVEYCGTHPGRHHLMLQRTVPVTRRNNSPLHQIGIGRRHARARVLVLVHDRHIRVLDTDGELLRELTLDPSRDYQPQPGP